MKAVFERSIAVASVLAFALQASCGGDPKPPPTSPSKRVDEPSKPPAPAPTPKGPFLYKVTKGEHAAYLFGTIHIGVSPKNDLPPVVWNTFTSSKVLVLELDPSAANPFSLLAKALNLTGKPLDEQLGKEHWEKLQKLPLPMEASKLRRVQPWLVQMLLAAASIDSTVMMEPEFIEYAKANEITLDTLETVDDQIAALEGSFSIDDLKEMIDSFDEHVRLTKKLSDAYREGDLDTFLGLFGSDMEEGSKSEDLLLRKRNETWVPKLETLVAAGGAFIAVGAGHLYGKYGLIALLEAKGYEITRMGIDTGSAESAVRRAPNPQFAPERPATARFAAHAAWQGSCSLHEACASGSSPSYSPAAPAHRKNTVTPSH